MSTLKRYTASFAIRIIAAAAIVLSWCCNQVTAQNQSLEAAHDRSASVQGRIVDDKGKPLVASVVVYGRAIIDGKLDLFAMCATTSANDGNYECRSLRPGQYIISALTKTPDVGESPAKGTVVKDAPLYPRTFSPGTTDLDDGTILTLSHAEIGIADIVIHPITPFTVKGALVTKPNRPSFLLRARLGSFDLPTEGHVDYDPATGFFTITGVPEAMISLSVDWADGGIVHHEYGVASVAPGRNNTITTVEIMRHHVAGQLVFPADNTSANVFPNSVQLSGLGDRSGWHLEAEVNPDGKFAFPDIADGDYAVLAVTSSGLYVNALGNQAKTVIGDVLRLRPDIQAVSTTIQLGSTRAKVSGKVKAGEILPDKTEVLLESLRDSTLTLGNVDPYGNYAFGPLPPGDYRLFAWKDISTVEYRDAGSLAKQKDRSIEIHLDNDSQLSGVELPIITANE